MKNQVHVSIQIVPISRDKHPYDLIDRAIDVIEKSGVKFLVGPMETVMQGDYDTLMQVTKKAQEVCLESGAEEVVVTIKVHARKNADVTWDEKRLDRVKAT